MADRIAVMLAGRIVEIGRTADVLARPGHPFTRALLAALPQIGGPRGTDALPPKPLREGAAGGCRYFARCPIAEGDCARDEPPLVEADRQRVRCRLWGGGGESRFNGV